MGIPEKENKSVEQIADEIVSNLGKLRYETLIPITKEDCWKKAKEIITEALRVERQNLEESEVELAKLKGERCYICRPNDPQASEEGCSDCDEKSDLVQTALVLQSEISDQKELIEKIHKVLREGVSMWRSEGNYVSAQKLQNLIIEAFPPAMWRLS